MKSAFGGHVNVHVNETDALKAVLVFKVRLIFDTMPDGSVGERRITSPPLPSPSPSRRAPRGCVRDHHIPFHFHHTPTGIVGGSWSPPTNPTQRRQEVQEGVTKKKAGNAIALLSSTNQAIPASIGSQSIHQSKGPNKRSKGPSKMSKSATRGPRRPPGRRQREGGHQQRRR